MARTKQRETRKEIQELEFNASELVDLVEKTLNFTEIFCNREFYPYQSEFAEAILKDIYSNSGNSFTGLFARQSGKSETVANLTSSLMVLLPTLANLKEGETYLYPQLYKFRHGLYVGIFAPSGLQATTTYKRVRDRIASHDAAQILESRDFAPVGEENLTIVSNSLSLLELSNKSMCMQMSADKQSNIESKTFHLICLDEAQDLDEFVVNKSIMPMGAHTNASTIATGTPGITKSYFYNMIQQNKNELIKYGKQKFHFEYDYKVCQKYNKNYKRYIQKEKKRIGEDSDEFRMAYKLHWLLERGMAVSQELFDRLTVKSNSIQTNIEAPRELVAGLDFGKGSDSTVLTIGEPRREDMDESGKCPVDVVNWWTKVGDNYESIFAELKEEISKYNIRTMACDATGVGEPLVDRLIWELPDITIIPVKFSPQAKDHLYKNFLLMLQEEKVSWPGDSRLRKRKYWKEFEHQMTNLQKEYRGQYLACHAPEDQKDARDDFPDSLALMLWTLHEEAFPFIEVSTGNFYDSDRKKYRGQSRLSKQQFNLKF